MTRNAAKTIETLTLFQIASAGARKTKGSFCKAVGSHFITNWPDESHAINSPRLRCLIMPSSVY